MKKHWLKLIASFTFDPIIPYLNKVTTHLNITLDIFNNDYGQVFQELLEKQTQPVDRAIYFYAIRSEDFVRNLENCQEQERVLQQTFDRLITIWSQKDFKSPVFIIILPSSLYQGHPLRNKVDELNRNWLNFLTGLKYPNITVIDCRMLREEYFLERVLDPKRNEMGHIPFTEEFFMALAIKIVKSSFSIFYKPFKVLVVDADNTLWDGICSELGPKGVKVDKPYQIFQRFLKDCSQSGYLLALVSKNVESDVLAVFDQCNEMLLVPEDFVMIKANWKHKSKNIGEIASELGLGADSFCFFDDNMTECTEVSNSLPQVLTLPMPTPDKISDFVDQLWFLKRFEVTQEDLTRSSHYKSELKRKKVRVQIETLDFLRELKIKVGIFKLQEVDLPRASQLTKRTNQFNSATIRREVAEIEELKLKSDVVWGIEVSDKFGYYGFTGILIGTICGNRLDISDFLLSCRVLGKKIECSIYDALIAECKSNQLSILRINFQPTERNEPVQNFLEKYKGHYNPLNKCFDFKVSDYTPPSFLPEIIPGKIQKMHVIDTHPIFRFHHIGVAVEQIKDAAKFYLNQGYSGTAVLMDTLQNVFLMMLEKDNDLSVELVAPVDEYSPVVDILSKNDTSPYHLSYQVENIEEALKYLQAKGINYDIVKPVQRAILFNSDIIFIYVKGVGLIEFVEISLDSDARIQDLAQIFIASNQKHLARFFFETVGYDHVPNCSDSFGKILFKNENGPLILVEDLVPNKENPESGYLTKPSQIEYYFALGVLRNQPETSYEKLPYLRTFQDQKVDSPAQNQSQARWRFKEYDFEYGNLLHNPIYKLLATDSIESLQNYFDIQNDRLILGQSLPENPKEYLTLIWENLLGQQNLDPRDNFFDLGGHSLLATQIIARIHKDMKVDIKLSEFFDAPTIEQLVELIHTSKHVESSKEHRIQPIWNNEACYELSYAQKQMWVFDRLKENTSFNNMIRAYRLSGELDVQLFKESIDLLIQRHEILRTVFLEKEDNPKQKILTMEEYGFKLEFVDLKHEPKSKSIALKIQAETAVFNFDIKNGPLLKMKLLWLGEKEFIFLLTIHHLITDGWSMGVFFRDLTSLYSSLLNKNPNKLKPLRFQYKDFAAHSNQEIDRKKEYWNDVFQNSNFPFVEVPTDFSRPDTKTFNGAAVTFEFNAERIDRLNEICRSQQISTYVVLIAIYKLLLYKWTGMTDIIIGTPTAGRFMHELENQIGPYINTLVLRTRFDENNSFHDLLRNIRGVVLGAMDNQIYPFELLLEDLGIDRLVNRSPLFETGFTWQSHQELDGAIQNVEIHQLEQQDIFSQHDIWLLGAKHPKKKEYNFTLIYNSDLYTSQTAKKFANDFRDLAGLTIQHGEKSLFSLVQESMPIPTRTTRTDFLISEDF